MGQKVSIQDCIHKQGKKALDRVGKLHRGSLVGSCFILQRAWEGD